MQKRIISAEGACHTSLGQRPRTRKAREGRAEGPPQIGSWDGPSALIDCRSLKLFKRETGNRKRETDKGQSKLPHSKKLSVLTCFRKNSRSICPSGAKMAHIFNRLEEANTEKERQP